MRTITHVLEVSCYDVGYMHVSDGSPYPYFLVKKKQPHTFLSGDQRNHIWSCSWIVSLMVSNGIFACIPIWCKIKADHELAEIGLALRRTGYDASASYLHAMYLFQLCIHWIVQSVVYQERIMRSCVYVYIQSTCSYSYKLSQMMCRLYYKSLCACIACQA